MKVSITKEDLAKSLSIVSKGMSSRSTLPILSGILISTTDKEIVFQTTDLEIFVKHLTAAFVEDQGQAVVPGKLLSEIVRNLPDAAVQISNEDEQIKIECQNSSFILNTMNPLDFPRFPEVSKEQEITLPVATLSTMVHQVSKTVSKDQSRAILTGILFTLEGRTLRLVATDSYRLAITEHVFESIQEMELTLVVPGHLFEEIIKNVSPDDDIAIGIAENQILFEFGTTTFITRKIEGNYPNYKQLIPDEKTTGITVETGGFISAIKRVSLLAQNHTPIKMIFSAADQNVEIVSQTQDIGGAREVVPAEIIGEDIEIGFNPQYIIDGMVSIPTDETLIEVQSSLKPGIFKSTGEDNYLYLAMPVRLG